MLEVNYDISRAIQPSGRRATTRPDPTRPENRKPALEISNVGRGSYLEDGDDRKTLRIGKDRGRDDFVRPERLTRIHETHC